MSDAKTPWGGRFTGTPGEFQQRFGASLGVDARLYAEDIAGSIAHARMLAARSIISTDDAVAIEGGLLGILRDIEAGTFAFDLADEDIHMAVEGELTRRIGEPGKRLHTGRSRNDQVATDTRLHAKREALRLFGANAAVRATIHRLAEDNIEVIVPGYTHLQKAQPVLLSHHLLAYSWMLARDAKRLRNAYKEADALPLGSAALAGTTFDIDRGMVAHELGFSSVIENSLDAVSDRDFLVDLTYACTLGMVHLSRLAEELILWSTEEFGFITLDDAWSTGSSIMPQKKNPDFAELVRGKTGRVVGDLTALLVTLKGLPLAYNKDMQEDKEPAFDAIDTYADSLRAVEGMLATLRVNAERMAEGARGGFMAATDLADYLAAHGVPFREAHEIVGKLVLSCEREGRVLQDFTHAELQAASPVFGDDALATVAIDAVVARRTSEGGTAPGRVREQLALATAALARDERWLAERTGSSAVRRGGRREGEVLR
ncbi:MAG: argininosuccinate lyase [Actinomycetota bacterium]|nr:MAG: argininosuccinate [Actinomycetota bacterium]MDO8950737.1 argininosuccinate lyase [Actinomycetota bacterium]MDP3629366.1 argininosuccinate lyase [Actinomycetota bacterium]